METLLQMQASYNVTRTRKREREIDLDPPMA